MSKTKQEYNKRLSNKIGKFKHSINLKNKIISIEDDLNNPNTVAFLGREPIYIHNIRKNAEYGLEVVTKSINKVLIKKIKLVKKELDSWTDFLWNQEKELYAHLPIDNINNGLQYLQQWWEQVTSQNPNQKFNTFINSLFSLKQIDFDLQKLTNKEKENPNNFIKSQELADKTIDIILQYLKYSISRSNDLKRKRILQDYQTKLTEITHEENGKLVVDLNQLQNVQATLGKLYESAVEIGGKFIQNKYGLELLHYAEEIYGKKGQAASDLKLTIGSVSVGLSAKLRKLNKKEGKDYITKLRYGSSATGETLESYFNNPNASFNLNSQEIDKIKYAIANWKSFSPINNSTDFQNSLTELLAWNKVIFGFLGKDYKQSTLPPTFLVSFNQIIPMRWLLIKILKIAEGRSNESILDIVNKSTGSWQTKNVLGQKARDNLYKKKKQALRKLSRNKQTVTYNTLKNNILPDLKDLNIKIGSISVKYKILVSNFNELSVYDEKKD